MPGLLRCLASSGNSGVEENGIDVRVIEYILEGVPDAEPVYRLITTILTPKCDPQKGAKDAKD